MSCKTVLCKVVLFRLLVNGLIVSAAATGCGGRPAPTTAPGVLAVGQDVQLVRYDFEDDFMATGIVKDRSGNGHDARVNGAVARGMGISGGHAIAFSGDGYIQADSNPAAGRKDVTFAFWFKTDDPGANYKLASAA